MSEAELMFDVVVVGAGPGGIAAAVTAAEAGKTVALIDDNPHLGGQIWRHAGNPPSSNGAARWFPRLRNTRGITVFSSTQVVASLGCRRLLAQRGGEALTLTYGKLILATGARELFLPFPGWTRPGVFGAGAMQALIKSGLPVRGRRVVVAGTGPLLLAVAELLRAKGAVVPCIVEQADFSSLVRFGLSLWKTPGKLIAAGQLKSKLLGVPYLTSSWIKEIEGSTAGGSLAVQVASPSKSQQFECDFVACGFHLIPNLELPLALGCPISTDGFVHVDERMQVVQQADVCAVGELTGIGGVEKSLCEGQIAGLAAAGREDHVIALNRQRSAAQGFARRLSRTFTLRKELFGLADASTVVCRCEDVTRGQIDPCTNLLDAKLQTRCGMGPCQGRICGPVVSQMLGLGATSVRPPFLATSIQILASGTKCNKM